MSEQIHSTFYADAQEEVLEHLETSLNGLSSSDVKKRLEQYGLNALPEEQRKSWFDLLFAQVKSFLIIILIVAAVISYMLHDKTDAYIILIAVLINVVVGFIQEYKAERSLAALRQVITLQAKVIRDGRQQIIESEEVVPGDILVVDAGDKIPADARLLESSELETNEAALTGESAEVVKQLEAVNASAGVGDRTNMLYFGTTVTKGSGTAVVTATGTQTEIGRIADLLNNTEQDLTPLQKRLNKLANMIGIIVLTVAGGIMLIGVLQGISFVEIFTTAVAIAVAAIPEGLVIAVTIILAIGMQRILKRNSLVRNLQAAETLGSTSVICTDKTGTLTEGNMQVVSLVTHDYHFDELHQVERHQDKGLRELIFALNIGMLCNDAHIIESETELGEHIVVGNLTERALLSAGMNIGLNHTKLSDDEPRIAAVAFNSTRKFMATLHEHPKQGRRMYVKGAPERIMNMSSKIRSGTAEERFTDKQRAEFEKQFIEYSKNGLRILALAYKDVSKDTEDIDEKDVTELVFVGFVGIKDPLRPSIRKTFDKTAAAGIRTVMITGDHKLTAQAIARELGLPADDENIMTGEELHAMTQEELNAVVENISVYARVSPEDKLNIINAWKSKNKVVAMTGDGVNDSPALKAADIGVALGSGTDVAKEAADIVLLDDHFDTIVAAVEEGRGIFDNIRKVVLYLMSDAFSGIILIVGSLIVDVPLPLTAAQILWINLISDGPTAIALTMEDKDEAIMLDEPRSQDEPVMNNEMKLLIGIVSGLTALASFIVYFYYLDGGDNLELARSIVFATLGVTTIVYAFSIRSLRHSIMSISLFSNPWLLVGAVVSTGVLASAFYVPFLKEMLQTVSLSSTHWLIVFVIAIVVVIAIEIVKAIYRHIHHKVTTSTN